MWRKQSIYAIQEYQHYCIKVPVSFAHALPEHPVFSAAFLGSAQVYWDGKLLAEKGIPGTSNDDEVSGPISVQVPMSPQQTSAGAHWLTLKLSTYHHIEDLHQIIYFIAITDFESATNTHQHQVIPLLLCGSMLLLALCFALIYWRYQKSKPYLLFSALCLMSGLIIFLELIKYYWNYPWPLHTIRLRVITPSVALTTWLLLAYYLHFYRHKNKNKWLTLAAATFLFLGLISPSYDVKNLAIFLSGLGISLWVNLIALREGKSGAATHSILLSGGLLLLYLLPFSFIDQWFAALFSLIALANLYSLTGLFSVEREQALQAARLETELLRRNLQPHFLMNSLTLINEWVETKPHMAVEFIHHLAAEFRLLNEISQQLLVTWSEERLLCEQHFAIMKQRLQKVITLEIQDDVDTFLLPPAIVHCLIENAFSHNRVIQGDRFSILIKRTKDNMTIETTTPYRIRKHQGSGTGEQYIKTRLEQCFPAAWQFTSTARENFWICQISFPFLQTNND